ncbi:GGDEF domain-containing protein [Companilactobacillus huachuanensis]|uniref:GGDEF domain-containing protein n=1 Tax=Companilactobacillus huachuanensis TaxID=2559914 RepID=A0ABW1RK08_9LACO|nr:GGDEF domain-containing protein [Companilactobacillus huachuanensis]
MPDNTLEKIINNYLNINSAIITLVTIGLITIITIVAYSLERRISNSSPLYRRAAIHIVEGVILASSMIMLEKIFFILNKGSINNGWLYANAQLTILLYCMYLVRNKVTLLINLFMPLFYYQSMIFKRFDDKNLPLFITAYLFLIAIIIFIYIKTEKLQDNEWKYVGMQAQFGLAWWALIWTDHDFPAYEIFNMLVVFLIYMSIIRFCARKMQDTMMNYNDLKVQVNYDELTGVRNRANFDKTSKELFETYSKEAIPLTVTMFDIDHFKEFNDKYGHSIGDEVLKHVAHTMEREMFLTDTKGQLFRFGGEEFIIIFRGKNPSACIPIVSDLRNTLINTPLVLKNQRLDITISFGISELKLTDKDFDNLFNRVDQFLYDSKNSGRNHLTVEGVTYSFDDLNEKQ